MYDGRLQIYVWYIVVACVVVQWCWWDNVVLWCKSTGNGVLAVGWHGVGGDRVVVVRGRWWWIVNLR